MLPRFRDVMTTLVARGLAMMGPFVVSVVTARVLGPEDRGLYFLVVSYAAMAAQIANLGLHSSNTYLVANHPERLGALTVNSIYVAAIVAPLVALVLVVFFTLPASSSESAGLASFVAVLLAPLLVGFIFLTNLAVGVGRLPLFNGLTIFAGIAAIAAAGLAALLNGRTLTFLLAAVAAMAVSCLVVGSLLLAGKRIRARFDLPLFRQGVAYAARAYLATLFGFLMMRVGVIALQQRASLEEIGQFSIAMQVSDALILIPGTVGLLLFPGLVRAPRGDRWRATLQTLWRLGLLMVVMLMIVGLTTPIILPMVFGTAYERAVPMTQALMLPAFLISLVTVISQYLAAEGFPWRQVHAWGAGFVLQAGLSYWLAGTYGGMGVAFALAASSVLVLVILGTEALAMRKRDMQPSY